MQRKLDNYEAFLWQLGRDEPWLLQWNLAVEGEIKQESYVERALLLLQKQHPILNSTITTTPPFVFKPTSKPIRLRVHNRANNKSWHKHSLRALEKTMPLSPDETIFIVDWVKGKNQHEFILTMDHAFCDARSIIGLGCDFLKFLDKAISDIVDIKIKYFPELPPIYNMLPVGKPAASNFSDIQTIIADPAKPVSKTQPYKPRLTHVIQLTEEQTKKLLTTARSHGCTVHSLFAALSTHTLNDYLQKDQYTGETFCFSPVDFRSYLNAEIEGKELGNFAAEVFHPFKVGKIEELWPLARKIKQQIVDSFASDSLGQVKRNVYNMVDDHTTTAEQIVSTIKIRDTCTIISNAGIIPMQEKFHNLKFVKMQLNTVGSFISGRERVFWLGLTTIHGKLQIEFLRMNSNDKLDVVPQFAEHVVDKLAQENII
jgi:NRPS condensation-like uncharacterized protein